MKNRLQSQDPPAVVMDTTFGTNVEGYKLLLVTYGDGITGKTAVAAVVILATEDDINVEYAFKIYRAIHNPRVILVDKDLPQFQMLERLFPETSVLLCFWHVRKYWRRVLANSNVSGDTKHNLLKQFTQLVQVTEQADFQLLETKFREAMNGIQLHLPGKKESEPLTDYYTGLFRNNDTTQNS